MVDMNEVVRNLPSGTALFPAYTPPPREASCINVKFRNDANPYPRVDGPLDWFEITTPLHSSFDAEWPIPVDVPLALRGFRHALGLSQAKFADRVGQGRLNIERWEAGKSRPFRGHTLTLLSLLRPLVDGPLAAGQLLNLAAAVVCPLLTRPAATYRGHEIAHMLADKHLDHADLAPGLLEALVSSEVLVPLDDVNDGLDIRYVPLVGVRTLDRELEPWETELLAVARRLDPSDRPLWLTMGKRLGQASIRAPESRNRKTTDIALPRILTNGACAIARGGTNEPPQVPHFQNLRCQRPGLTSVMLPMMPPGALMMPMPRIAMAGPPKIIRARRNGRTIGERMMAACSVRWNWSPHVTPLR